MQHDLVPNRNCFCLFHLGTLIHLGTIINLPLRLKWLWVSDCCIFIAVSLRHLIIVKCSHVGVVVVLWKGSCTTIHNFRNCNLWIPVICLSVLKIIINLHLTVVHWVFILHWKIASRISVSVVYSVIQGFQLPNLILTSTIWCVPYSLFLVLQLKQCFVDHLFSLRLVISEFSWCMSDRWKASLWRRRHQVKYTHTLHELWLATYPISVIYKSWLSLIVVVWVEIQTQIVFGVTLGVVLIG